MKIQSPLSNTKFKTALFVTMLILVVGIVSQVSTKSHRTETYYHVSQWSEFSPEVERALAAMTEPEPLKLGHIYGGVVPHHIPTTIPQLVEFYSRLKQAQPVKNFIIVGPDHTDAGKTPISTSQASFFTKYGQLQPIDGLAQRLEEAQLAHIDELPFPPEHSIGSQVLIISKIFPEAKITPIILRADVTRDHAAALGKMLAGLLDKDTVLIASVDFSHYLSSNQAIPIDQISGEVVRNLDVGALSLIAADSGKSMVVFMSAMDEKEARGTDGFTVLNTNDLMQNSDYTTGYVFGFWGSEPGR